MHGCGGGWVKIHPVIRDHYTRMNGEPVMLDSASAVTLGLVFHELAANAARHGAMSAPEGRIEISWRLGNDPKPSLNIAWSEHGMRQSKAPRREGFGFRIIKSSIASNLEGKADVTFTQEGVRWRLAFPMRTSESDLDTTTVR